jgi:hypothetical protein
MRSNLSVSCVVAQHQRLLRPTPCRHRVVVRAVAARQPRVLRVVEYTGRGTRR